MEAHSWLLAKGLEARGHEVTLFAAGGSDPGLRVRPIIDRPYDEVLPWAQYRGSDALTAFLDEAYQRACQEIADGAFDVVHNNSLHRFPLRPEWTDRTPTVTSLHVPPYPALHGFVTQSPGHRHRITVTSARQLEAWFPESVSDAVSVLHNGVDLDLWRYTTTASGGAVWSGRISPNKGAHLAIDAAIRLGLSIRLFGPIDDLDYWSTMIEPRLSERATYGGHLSSDDLAQALGDARLYFFTPLWDEPFGLAAVEAMACGVPIAALDNGAAREVVGRGGVIASAVSVSALAQAGSKALSIPRSTARQQAETFSMDRWLTRCEALYAQARSV